jgi:hypothetical protein
MARDEVECCRIEITFVAIKLRLYINRDCLSIMDIGANGNFRRLVSIS